VLLLGLGLSVLVGVSLGLLGGGGSILTMPILVSVLGVRPAAAVGMSLVVVGATSAVGAVLAWRRGQVSVPLSLTFGGAGVTGALIGARLTPLVAEHLLTRLFGVLMLIVAVLMARPRRVADALRPRAPRIIIVVAGFAVGVLTGFLGVGGGFLILPALLWAGRLPMRQAVGTSLVAIALGSSAGIVGHLGHAALDWPLTAAVASLSLAGMVLGQIASRHISAGRVRHAFAGLVGVVGATFLART
jgi:uncharacterized protein